MRSRFDSQFAESEQHTVTSPVAESSLTATLTAIEACLRALELTTKRDERERLHAKCQTLLAHAERVKTATSSSSITKVTLEDGAFGAGDASSKVLNQPVSTRTLSTREQIILLKSSKLHGSVFPPWKGSPSPDEFKAKDGLLYTDPTDFRFTEDQLRVFDGWRRPPEVLTMQVLKTDSHEKKNIMPTMVMHEVKDLVQDMTSDCSVVASFCAGTARAEAGHTKILSSIMYPYDHSSMRLAEPPNGKHIFKLNFNGCFRKVVIDDRLPASRTIRSLHVIDRNNPGLLWPALIEKAYLKIMGGYDFPGSNSGTDLWILAGWIPEQLYLQSGDITPNALWRRISTAFCHGDVLITIGTGKLSHREEGRTGLTSEHDYAVVDLKEEDDRRLFRLKNPWSGASRWKEKENTELRSTIATTCDDNLQDVKQRSGIFWMNLNDVFQYYENIYLSWNPGIFSHREDIHFTWNLVSGTSPAGSFYRNPQFCAHNSRDGHVWLLLTRHFSESFLHGRDSTADDNLDSAYLSLYAFKNGGYKEFLSEGPLMRGPYVDSPNTLLRLEMPENSKYTIVVSEQDLPPSEHSFTLTAFSLTPVTIEQANNRFSHSSVQNSAWTLSTAGGNAGSLTYHRNPQFSLQLSSGSDLALFLEVDDENIPVHVKLLWADGKRAFAVTTRDIVGDSGEYRRGSALAKLSEVQAGTYTVVCSTFQENQLSKFSLHVCSMSECVVRHIPLEEAGRLVFHIPIASFTPGLDRLLTPLHLTRITRLRVQASNTILRSASRSPLRVALEYGQGPNKRILSISGSGEFREATASVRTDDVDLVPQMCMSQGVWLVVERIGALSMQTAEEVQLEILSDQAVSVAPWGKEMDEPVERRLEHIIS